MFVPVGQFYPQYVKKNELESFIKKTAKQLKISYTLLLSTLIISQVMVPSILIISGIKFAINFPLIIGSILLGLGGVIYVSNISPVDMEKVAKLRKDSSELITIDGPLVNKRLQWMHLGYAVVTLISILGGVAYPLFIGSR